MNVSTRTSTAAANNNCQSKPISKTFTGFNRWMLIPIVAIFALLSSFNSFSQTTLISPTGNGGFELGGTPLLNGWTAVNSSTDAWHVGSVSPPGASAGSNSAFISSTAGATWGYSQISTVQHLYYDVTIPAGESIVTLNFKWKVGGEGTAANDWDNMRVFWGTAATVLPVANTTLPIVNRVSGNGATSGMYKLSSATYNAATINMSGTPGVTYRLVFSWKSDISDIVPPPAAIDEVSLVTSTPVSFTATANGGLWSSPATWVGGVVPPGGNDVVIPTGSIVTVDQLTAYRNLTIDGTVQWGSATTAALATAVAMTLSGDLVINAGGSFLPYSTTQVGITVNVGGTLNNNGYANFGASSLALAVVNFNGTSGTLTGSGTFQGNGTDGIIRGLNFQNTGSSTISTTQNIITNSFVQTAGSLNTGGKLKIDNTAQVYGLGLNRQVASVAVTNMGSLYSVAPVVFGVAVTQWNNITGVLNTLYVSGVNVYRCTAASNIGPAAPTHTTGIAQNLLWIGTTGTLGAPFQITANTVGNQYFYGNNLYTCIAATAVPSSAAPPTCTSGTCVSGGTTYLYVGSPATATVTYDAATLTVRSLNLTSAGSGLSAAPSVAMSVGVLAGAGSGAAATAVHIQQMVGTGNSATQKTTGTTISGGIAINSDQGTYLATANPQASSGVGAISTTNGGVNYTIAPTVGFAGPTALNLVTNSGSTYATAPTVSVDATNLVTGTNLTTANFTITMNQGQIVSIYLNAGTTATYSAAPTLTLSSALGGAAIAWPAGCWPSATATIASNGQLTNFTVTNPGFGYVATPTLGIGTISGSALGGTFTTVATVPTARIGLYNLTTSFFAPSTVATPNADDASIPVSRKINTLALSGNGNGLILANNLTLIGTAPLTLVASLNTPGNVLDLGGFNLNFTWNGYGGASSVFGASNVYIKNGSMSLTGRGGASTFTFPFSGTFGWFAGSTPTSITTGSTVTRVTVTEAMAPTGAGAMGTRSFNVNNGAAIQGLNPTVTMNWNSQDALTGNTQDVYISQATTALGPWTPRSASLGTGVLAATGSRTTATTVLGPIVPTGNDYFAWTSMRIDSANVTVPTGVCIPTLHDINADFTTTAGTITGATITYNNGAAVGPVAMTFLTGNTWTYQIPVASPGNTVVTWSVTATNSVGLTRTFAGTSYQDDPLTGATASIVASPNPVCSGAPTVLTATVTGGGLGAITLYDWNDGAGSIGTSAVNTFTVNPTVATTYTVTATNAAGCSVTSATGILVNITPLPGIPSGSNSSQCGIGVPPAGLFVASGATSPAGTGTFNWYSAPYPGGTLLQTGTSTTYTTSISATTNFYVSEMGVNGCQSPRVLITATVNPPDAISAVSSDYNPCRNTAITLTAANIAAIPTQIYTYTWTAVPQVGSGIPFGGTVGTSISVTPTVSGTYAYTATAVDGSCTTSATATNVVVKELPVISSATATPTTICSGANVALSATTTVINPTTVQMGTGTGTSSATSTASAFYGTWFGNGHAQIMVKGTELAAAGFVAGGNLTALSIDISAIAPDLADQIVQGFTIKLGSVPATTTTITTFQSPTFTTVYGPTNYTPVVGSNSHPFAGAGYTWDGTSNIIVDYCFANGIVGNGSAVNTVTNTTYGSFVNHQVDGASPTVCAITTVSLTSTNRPNIKFTGPVASQGAGSLAWTWNPGALSGNSVVVNPTTALVTENVTYTVSAYDAATTCTNTQNVIVTVNGIPSAPTASAPSDQCGTGVPTASVTSTFGLGTPQFIWYSALTGGTVLQTGTSTTYTTAITTTTNFYVVEISNGCESSPRTLVTANVTDPTLITAVVTPLSVCLGGTLDLSATQADLNNDYTYTWTSTAGSGLTAPTVGTNASPVYGIVPGVLPTAVGTYTYNVSANDAGTTCTATSSVTVTVYPVPYGATANASAAAVCTGTTVNLTSTGESNILGAPTTFYTQGFETAFPQAGMTYINAGTGPNSWAASSTAQTGTGAISYTFNSTNAANTWAITPGQLLTAGQTYTVTFWYRVISSFFPEKLKVTVGTSNTVAAQTTTLWDNNGGIDLTNTTYAQGTMTYVAPSTGTYYFGWNCYSDADQDVLYVDNIEISGAQAEPATFSWTSVPAGFTSSLQNPTGVVVNANTTYTVTVSNSGNCTTTASVLVNAIPLPGSPTATPSTQCGAGIPTASVTTGGGGAGFKWYSALTGGTLLQTGGSTYATSISATQTFYVSESDGVCESLRTAVVATVTAPPTLAITPTGSTTYCLGGSVILDAGASPTDPSYTTFSWSPATGLSATNVALVTANPTTTTTYTVTASGAGCTTTATVTVTVNALPAVPVPTATPATICANGSSQLDAGTYINASLSAPILGGNGNAGNVFDVTASQTVTINSISMGITSGTLAEVWYIAGGYGCTASLSSNVGWTLLTPIGGSAITAAGAAPALTNIPLTSTITIPAGQTYGFVVVCNGANYYTNGTTLCAINASDAYISIGQGIGGSGMNGAFSFFNSVRNFNGAVGYTYGDPSLLYSWSPTTGLNDPTLISPVSTLASGSQSYQVTVTNAAGCTATSVVPATVTVSSAPTATPTAAPATICVGSSSTLSANAVGAGPFTYLWSNAAATATITVSPITTTTYTVIVTDVCSNSTSAQSVTVTVNDLPTASINEGPTTICAPATYGLSVTTTAAATIGYQWTLNGANISGATSATYAASAVGANAYAVKVTDGVTGCTVTSASVVVTINPQPTPIVVSPATTNLCTGASVTLTATGGTIGGTYSLGTDATVTSTSGITPYNSLWEGSREQYLVRASELTALGMIAGSINSLAFDVTIAGPGTFAQTGFTIKMAHTANTDLTGSYGTPTGSFSTVYGPVNLGAPVVGLNTYTFSSAFVWDGISNVLVDICHDNDIANSCVSCFSTSSTVKYTNTSFNSTYGTYADNVQSCGLSVGTIISTFTNRPNMVFNSNQATTTSWTPITDLNTATGNVVIANPATSVTYTAKATSVAGCESVAGTSVITVADCPVTVNLKVWLQGYYIPGGSMQPVLANQGVGSSATDVDDVTIELHDATTYALVEAQTAVLQTSGLVSATFAPKAFAPYYIVVKHRNTVQTWSANPVAINGATPLYNFTSAPTQAAGSNQALVETGVWAMYTGDINQDDFIDSNDFTDLDTDIFNGVALVYVATDLNGDGFVDSNDFTVIDANIFNGVAAAFP